MASSVEYWERLVRLAEEHAHDGSSEKAADLLKVAAEIRLMVIGLRQIAVAEANAGSMRMVVQATTQNEHTVNRPSNGEPNG